MNKSSLKLDASQQRTSSPLVSLLHQLESLDPSSVNFPVAISVPASQLDPFQWLNANAGQLRFIWTDRTTSEMFAGVGEAARVEVASGEQVAHSVLQCRNLLSGNSDLKFFGGLSFDGTANWNTFGAGTFILPRLQLADNKMTLAIMNAEDIRQARSDLNQIRFEPKAIDPDFPSHVAVRHVPTAEGWQTRIDEALALIRSEAVEKIVLSRKTIFEFDQALNPITLAHRLLVNTHDCFVFCLHHANGPAFVGATPEQLFLRQQNRLFSEVIAGTRMRGATPEDDQRLADELLHSDKDQREHDIVRKSIRQKLHKFVEHLTVDNQASLLKLAKKQHLRSNVEAELKPDVNDGMLLQRLHPTPAVGGYPTDNALPEIARIERFNRGWYAAPIGWIGSDSAQFAVAIRSGLIESNSLTLYSGAGIVRGSIPEQEWQEVENKIQDFVNVFGT